MKNLWNLLGLIVAVTIGFHLARKNRDQGKHQVKSPNPKTSGSDVSPPDQAATEQTESAPNDSMLPKLNLLELLSTGQPNGGSLSLEEALTVFQEEPTNEGALERILQDMISDRQGEPDFEAIALFAKLALPANPNNRVLTQEIIGVLESYEQIDLGRSLFSEEIASDLQLKSPHYQNGIATFLKVSDPKEALLHAQNAAENSDRWEYSLSYAELLETAGLPELVLEEVQRSEGLLKEIQSEFKSTPIGRMNLLEQLYSIKKIRTQALLKAEKYEEARGYFATVDNWFESETRYLLTIADRESEFYTVERMTKRIRADLQKLQNSISTAAH
jgi:tetratricopeptide (TPR) repeat protein